MHLLILLDFVRFDPICVLCIVRILLGKICAKNQQRTKFALDKICVLCIVLCTVYEFDMSLSSATEARILLFNFVLNFCYEFDMNSYYGRCARSCIFRIFGYFVQCKFGYFVQCKILYLVQCMTEIYYMTEI
jgi:hypothetical protein